MALTMDKLLDRIRAIEARLFGGDYVRQIEETDKETEVPADDTNTPAFSAKQKGEK